MRMQLCPIQPGCLKATEDMLHNNDFLVSTLVRAKFTFILHVIKCKRHQIKCLQEILKNRNEISLGRTVK